MFSRYSFKTGSFFSLHPSLPAFLPFSLSSSFPAFLPFSLSPPDPFLFPSFHSWRTCCVPGTVSSATPKKARWERHSLCLRKVWSGGGVSTAHRGPRPALHLSAFPLSIFVTGDLLDPSRARMPTRYLQPLRHYSGSPEVLQQACKTCNIHSLVFPQVC